MPYRELIQLRRTASSRPDPRSPSGTRSGSLERSSSKPPWNANIQRQEKGSGLNVHYILSNDKQNMENDIKENGCSSVSRRIFALKKKEKFNRSLKRFGRKHLVCYMTIKT